MYTSDIKAGMKYFAASIVIAFAAAVYGLFGHGVYSYFMTYAFMIPLLGGALPHLIAAMKAGDAADVNLQNNVGGQTAPTENENTSEPAKIFDPKDAQLAVITTLTAGSLLKGVLDIYGTTNRLLIAYPVMAVIVFAAALAAGIKRRGNTGNPAKTLK